MHDERILYLFTRRLSEEITPAEQSELDVLLAAHPDMLPSLKLLEQFWNDREHTDTLNVEASLQKVLGQINASSTEGPFITVSGESTETERRTLSPAFRWLAAAAVAGLVALGGFYAYRSTGDTSIQVASVVEKQNGKGVKSTIELPDGSKIWLNADSKLSYPQAFNEKTREVHLSGEAFFDIRKNPAKPFVIHLTNGTVRVLGTSFNIRAYEDEDKIETSVSTGKVAFIPKKPQGGTSDTVFLTPNRKVQYSFLSGKLVTQNTRSKEDKAWVEGKMIFKSMTLEDIARELERNFGKKVVFRSNEPKQYRLTGSFHNNTLDEIMFYLSKTKEFSYQITNEELLIAKEPDELRIQN